MSVILLLCMTLYCSFYFIAFFVMVLCLFAYSFTFFHLPQYFKGIFKNFQMFFCEYDYF